LISRGTQAWRRRSSFQAAIPKAVKTAQDVKARPTLAGR
jgi:hypothetical protein